MAEQHISVPTSFAGGDVAEWFQRFEICSRANRWDAAMKTLKLHTLLEGEVLAIWMDLSVEEKDSYETAKQTLTSKLTPASFVTLDEFHRRKLLPGEALSVFVHHLKKLLLQVMPDLDTMTRNQLLLHQFVAGLPQAVSRQLRVTGQAKDLAATMERAQLLISLDDQGQTATVREGPSVVEWLQEQIEKLTKQVTALSTFLLRMADTDQGQSHCFDCNRVGHIQHMSPYRRQGAEGRRCFICNRQGRPRGACRRQQAPPSSTVSLHCSVVTVATTKSKAATVWGELGVVKAEVMLDSGSSVSLVWKQMLSGIKDFECVNSGTKHLKPVTASGAELPVLGHIRSSIQIGEIELQHTFVVVESLVASVILGRKERPNR